VINTDKAASQKLRLPTRAQRYTLGSSDLQSAQVQLNGADLAVDAKGDLPRVSGAPTAAVTSLSRPRPSASWPCPTPETAPVDRRLPDGVAQNTSFTGCARPRGGPIVPPSAP